MNIMYFNAFCEGYAAMNCVSVTMVARTTLLIIKLSDCLGVEGQCRSPIWI